MELPFARPGRDGSQSLLLELPQAQRRDPRPEGRRSGGFAKVSRFEQMDTDAAEASDRSRAHGCIPLSSLASSTGFNSTSSASFVRARALTFIVGTVNRVFRLPPQELRLRGSSPASVEETSLEE